jgi:hypothetical protein
MRTGNELAYHQYTFGSHGDIQFLDTHKMHDNPQRNILDVATSLPEKDGV